MTVNCDECISNTHQCHHVFLIIISHIFSKTFICSFHPGTTHARSFDTCKGDSRHMGCRGWYTRCSCWSEVGMEIGGSYDNSTTKDCWNTPCCGSPHDLLLLRQVQPLQVALFLGGLVLWMLAHVIVWASSFFLDSITIDIVHTAMSPGTVLPAGGMITSIATLFLLQRLLYCAPISERLALLPLC